MTEAVEEFLRTDLAKRMGYLYKVEPISQLKLRDLTEKRIPEISCPLKWENIDRSNLSPKAVHGDPCIISFWSFFSDRTAHTPECPKKKSGKNERKKRVRLSVTIRAFKCSFSEAVVHSFDAANVCGAPIRCRARVVSVTWFILLLLARARWDDASSALVLGRRVRAR